MGHKNYVHDLGDNKYLIDGKYYKVVGESSLTDWTCPKCGHSMLAYDVKLAKRDHTCRRKRN